MILFTLPPHPFPLLPPSLSQKWLIVNSFLEGCRRVGGWETTCLCYLNTQRHARDNHQTSSSSLDMSSLYWWRDAGSSMAGGVRVHCILGLAALWAQGDHKDRGLQALTPPWVRVRTAQGDRDRTPVWSEFILIWAVSSYLKVGYFYNQLKLGCIDSYTY